MSVRKIEGRPARTPGAHDQSDKRPRDAARQRALDQVVNEHRGKGPLRDVDEARRRNQNRSRP
jgi:hypothetical protein